MSPTIPDLEQGFFDTGPTTTIVAGSKAFSPIKISTRSTLPLQGNPKQQLAQDQLQHTIGPVENVTYSGMNVLLHQIHASRFGIPDEGELGDLYRQQQLQDQQLRQQQLQLREQQSMQQQQQLLNNPGVSTYMTTWHQPHNQSIRPVDEDDEMTDFQDGFSAPMVATLPGGGPQDHSSQGYFLTLPQPQSQSQQQQHQHPTQPSLQHHHLQQQAQEPNLYQDINAQLRAAFLARAQMEQRYR